MVCFGVTPHLQLSCGAGSAAKILPPLTKSTSRLWCLTCSAACSHCHLASDSVSDPILKQCRDDGPKWPGDDFLSPGRDVRDGILITGSVDKSEKGNQPSLSAFEGKFQSTFAACKVRRRMEALLFSHCSVRIFYLKTASCKKVKGFDFVISCSEICPGFLLLHTETHVFCPQHPKRRQQKGKRLWKMEDMTAAAQCLNNTW